MATTMIGKIEGLEEDIAAIKAELDAAMLPTMLQMMNETEGELYEAVEWNVYEAFDPKDYERRKENGGLIDFEQGHGTLDHDVNKNGFTLTYTPNGKSWQAHPRWVLNGDALIERIESASPAYDWSGDVPAARPFLAPLTEQLIKGGYEEMFVRNINQIDPKLEIIADGGVDRDADDWR